MRENEIVARSYDQIADAYLEWASRSPLRERWLNQLSGLLPKRGHVLDLGCGAGIPAARRLTEMGFSVLGIDGSSRQIALARKNAPQAEFRLGDMASISFPAEGFAAVTAFYSITHVPRAEHAAMFKRIARWLKPGGVLVASLGAMDCPDWTGEWLGTTMFFSHFDAEANLRLLEAAGLALRQYEVVGEEENGRMVEFLWIVARKPDAAPTGPTVGEAHLVDSAHGAFRLRPAASQDFQFAWSLYRDLMKPLTEELLGRWNDPGQQRVVELALAHEGTSIIVMDGLDAGWLHLVESPDSIYLGQLYLLPSLQNRGIGTAIMKDLMDRASQAGKALTLDVMKNNRARSLYERLGFRLVGESEYKLKMRWQNDSAGSNSR
jgi:SAM-dependent methyltransferase